MSAIDFLMISKKKRQWGKCEQLRMWVKVYGNALYLHIFYNWRLYTKV